MLAITPSIFTAYTTRSQRIGAVYYDPVKMTLFVLEDTPESKHFDMTKLRAYGVFTLFSCADGSALCSTGADRFGYRDNELAS